MLDVDWCWGGALEDGMVSFPACRALLETGLIRPTFWEYASAEHIECGIEEGFFEVVIRAFDLDIGTC